MRIIFMATGGFAVPTFEAILESSHEIVGLVTRPDRVSPRAKKSAVNPMRRAARSTSLPVFDPEGVNSDEAQCELAQLGCDLFVVCDYGQILTAKTLGLARLGGINLHGSLLPAYRGAAPINWAIYDGCTETGVTVIHMTPRMDAGPCLAERRVPIEPDETADQLELRLAEIGVAPVFEAIDVLETWDGHCAIGRPQDNDRASKAPRLKKTDGLVDWRRSSTQIANQVRAFQPWPGSYTFWLRDDREPLRVVLDNVRLMHDEVPQGDPGTTILADQRLVVATGSGNLSLERLQPAGKKPMRVAEFLRGYRVSVGDRFGDVPVR